MRMPEPLIVFEHEKLRVGDRGFTQAHFERLLAWNETNGFKYFDAGHQSIRFTQYVGVIQVGGLVIEVLPKADRDGDAAKWQRALIEMLSLVYDLPLTSTTESHLHKRRSTILDFFFDLYLSDVQGLVRRGLVKRYRQTMSNQPALKGRIHWPRHLRENLVHQERFHVVHQVYNTDHRLHALLKRALTIVQATALDPMIRGRAQDLDWAFEAVDDTALTPAGIDGIRLDRKTSPYARAVQLARMIVLDHAPDLRGGRTPLLGLMFDMNVLFERVVLKLLKRAAHEHRPELSITGQDSRLFWRNQKIRPDIVVRRGDEVVLIIDTKWKVPKDDRPADADLKQMYVYNRQYGSAESMLLYPGRSDGLPRYDYYADSRGLRDHGCSMRHIELFNSAGDIQMSGIRAILLHRPTVHDPTRLSLRHP